MEFISLCYHYIRGFGANDPFWRIWGNTEKQFVQHLELFKNEYIPLSLDNVRASLYEGKTIENSKNGLLVTFDDGLSDHYRAAQLLAEHGMKGVFFIPTCILEDGLPANPQIIHYTLAKYGVAKFLETYALIAESAEHPLTHQGNALETISLIKKTFKYQIPQATGRRILLSIYQELLHKDFPDIMQRIHLTEKQITEMVSMGHHIGTHTRTHISVAASSLDPQTFDKEIIGPQSYLSRTFETNVDAMSYPFGGKDDCLAAAELLEKTPVYKLAFTVEPKVNTCTTNPFEIGRFEPWPHHDVTALRDALGTMKS